MAIKTYLYLVVLAVQVLTVRVFGDDKTPNSMMNSIDSCWRSDPLWSTNRYSLANCAKGFGAGALGGRYGPFYVVTDPSDDPAEPKPGTLRYGVVQEGPRWITFEKDMVINLKHNLMMTSDKTIDGRGANVEISNGPCIRVVDVQNVIIHGISFNNCVPSKRGLVRKTWSHPPVDVNGQDGDAIALHHASNVWIDHCRFSNAVDGLVDITHESTNVTVSNNYLTQHDKVSYSRLCPDKFCCKAFEFRIFYFNH